MQGRLISLVGMTLPGRHWGATRRDTLAAGGQRRSCNLVVAVETALDAQPGTNGLAAGMVGPGRAARGADDARDADAVRDHQPGGRQPADGDVRRVRFVCHVAARRLRRRLARQAGRTRRAGARRQRAAYDRHTGQPLDAPGRDRHRPSCVRGLLRGRDRPQRGGRRNRGLASLRAFRLRLRGRSA